MMCATNLRTYTYVTGGRAYANLTSTSIPMETAHCGCRSNLFAYSGCRSNPTPDAHRLAQRLSLTGFLSTAMRKATTLSTACIWRHFVCRVPIVFENGNCCSNAACERHDLRQRQAGPHFQRSTFCSHADDSVAYVQSIANLHSVRCTRSVYSRLNEKSSPRQQSINLCALQRSCKRI